MSVDAVIDNSALLEFLAGTNPDPALIRRLTTARGAAPELIDAEALNALRRLVQREVITEEQGRTTLGYVRDTPIVRVSHRPLMKRAWDLRNAISPYDGLYVALAEDLDVPLITCDVKLSKSSGHGARFEVYATS